MNSLKLAEPKTKVNMKMVRRVKILRDVDGLSFRAIGRKLKKDVKQVWGWYQYD
jgi:hypothetical protein